MLTRTPLTLIMGLGVIFALLAGPQISDATNGMNMIGFGARMCAMGGASQAVSGDIHTMNTNPAGIGSIDHNVIGIGIGLLMPSVSFQNDLNDADADSKIFPLPVLAYVNGQEDRPWTAGFGLYAQGGMGASYPALAHDIFRAYDNDPRTANPLVEQEYHSNIAYMKAVPAFAYNLTPKLSAGIALNIGYAMMEMMMPYSLPPSAMVGEIPGGGTFGDMFGAPPEQGGLGYDEVTAYADMGDGVTAWGFGAKLGFHYQVNDQFSLGVSYTSQATLDFEGDASMDMSAQFGDAYEKMVAGALMEMGYTDPTTASDGDVQTAQEGVNTNLSNMGIDLAAGMVAEYDAEVEFGWPQEFGFGAAFSPNETWLFAADVKWINWSETMDSFKMSFSNGNNDNINAMMGTPDGSLDLEMPLNWDDQIVLGLGAEFWASPSLALRAGFNYASNPVPSETIIPIFPAVSESHATLGFGYRFSESLGVDAAYEFVPKVDVDADDSIIANEYDGSVSGLGENLFHVSLTYDF